MSQLAASREAVEDKKPKKGIPEVRFCAFKIGVTGTQG